MVGAKSSERVIKQLQALYEDPGFKQQHCEAFTGLHNSTISRILSGKNQRLKSSTLLKLASYIKHLTGHYPLANPLFKGKKEWIEEDLTGFDFTGHDLQKAVFRNCKLSHAKFWGTNLKDATFENVTGGYVEFQGANTDGVTIKNTNIHRWDLRATKGEQPGSCGWDGATFDQVKMLGFVHGVDFRKATLSNVSWKTGSGHSYGLRLELNEPEKEIHKGFDNPEVVSFLIEFHADGDRDLEHIAWKIRARRISRCWVGFLLDLETNYPSTIETLINIFKNYPGWHLVERVDLGYAMMDCKTLEDWTNLRKRKDYQIFRWPIENEIQKIKQE